MNRSKYSGAADFWPRQIAPSVSRVKHRVKGNGVVIMSRPGDIFADLNGMAVRQSKDDMLHQVRRIEMWKISTRAPNRVTVGCRALKCGRDAGAPRCGHRDRRRPARITPAPACTSKSMVGRAHRLSIRDR